MLEHIKPVRLGKNDQFNFKCHKDVKCFTRCCKGIDLVLTPYDILRLKNKLELDSEQFLAIYTKPNILLQSDLPVVNLKMLDEDDKACPFLKPEGCMIYDDRPTNCRYYPVGTAVLSYQEKTGEDDFFFIINEDHCLGFDEEAVWGIEEWKKDQGLEEYDKYNQDWAEFFVRKKSFSNTMTMTPKSKELFFMASYNLDKFKRFIFESDFLKKYNVKNEVIENIENNEKALLGFALKWLKLVFFKVNEFDKYLA